jgi:integrase/recombinase XerD
MRRVRAYFAWCEREGYLTGPNPTIRVPKIKTPEFVIPSFSADQLAAMLDKVDTSTPGGFRDSTILLVLIDTGMRVSELCGLSMMSLKDDYLVVFGKGNRQREVGIGPTSLRSLLKYVHQYRKAYCAEEQHIFLSLTGHALLKSDIRHIILKAAKAAGIEGVRASPHTVRHAFAQEWLNKGGDLASVSRLLGHAKIQTTENYLKGFQSREARQHHQHFSPVETNKLGRQISKSKRGRRKRDDD